MQNIFNSLTGKIESLRGNIIAVTKRKVELLQREAESFLGILDKLSEDIVKAISENALNGNFETTMNWRLGILECIRENVPELGKKDIYRGGKNAQQQKHGTGVLVLEERIYFGEFSNDSRQGKGFCLYKTGDRYEGQYNYGLPAGKGIYTYASGSKYEGDFVGGQGHGKGIFTHIGGDRYEGDFVDDKSHGRGSYYYSKGDRYEGEFVKGLAHGKGVYYYSAGGRFEGIWKDDKRHGKGVKFSDKGERVEQEFKDGKQVNV